MGEHWKDLQNRLVATGLCIGVAEKKKKKRNESKISSEFAAKESYSGVFSPIHAIFLPSPKDSLYSATPWKSISFSRKNIYEWSLGYIV